MNGRKLDAALRRAEVAQRRLEAGQRDNLPPRCPSCGKFLSELFCQDCDVLAVEATT